MSQIELIKAIEEGAVEWSAHALKTMFERDISREVSTSSAPVKS